MRTEDGRDWRLPSRGDQWQYPSQIDTIAGDKIEIPISRMWDTNKPDVLDRCQVTFTRKFNNIVIEDCFKKITLIKKKSNLSHYYLLCLDNMSVG